MLIFANGVGRLTVIPSQLNQNSNRANTIYLTGAFPSAAVVTLAFTLPDGTHTEPQLMTGDKTVECNGEKFIVREYTIPKNITQVKGRATVQFFIASNNGEETLATEATDITIARGVPSLTPADPAPSIYEQIVSSLSSIQTEFTNKLDKVTGATPNTLLYAKDKSGSQTMEVVDEAVSGQSIPRRSAYGTINVASAKNEDDAVNLQQMLAIIAEALVVKLDKSGGTISGDLEVGGDFVVKGDFTAQGKTFIEDATTLAVKNAIIETNAGKIDLKTLLSGLVINKNSTTAYGFVYDPTDDTVKFGQGSVDENGVFTFNTGEGAPIATRADSSTFTADHLAKWDAISKKFVDSGYLADNFVKAINAPEGQQKVYVASPNKPNDAAFLSTQKIGYTIPLRYADGQIEVGDPIGNSDAVPKKYAENNFVKAIIVTSDTYLYAANSESPNAKIRVDINASQFTVAERCANGRLAVGYPIADADAVHKKYVEDNFIPLKQISSGAFVVPQIGYNKEIYWLGSDVNLTSSSLAQRTVEGRLRATDPVGQYDLVNLQYFNANTLNSDNVKTLFGNQSILGTGNIDLYNHDIEITGMVDGSTPISIEFNRVSSKSLRVNSVNNLITLLGNEFRISVSGYEGDATSIKPIHMLSTTDGGGNLRYHIGTEDYAVADITDLTITDTVPTV